MTVFLSDCSDIFDAKGLKFDQNSHGKPEVCEKVNSFVSVHCQIVVFLVRFLKDKMARFNGQLSRYSVQSFTYKISHGLCCHSWPKGKVFEKYILLFDLTTPFL